MHIWVIVIALAVILLLVSESRNSQKGKWLAKPIASTGFLLLAHAAGAWTSVYGIAIFVALSLSWLGDVFLIPKSKTSFMLGLVSFLLGHIAFGTAFVLRGFQWTWGLATLAVVTVLGLFVGRWLKKYVTTQMWKPVVAYIVVISLMVVTAVASYPATQNLWIPIGALAFYISDLAVARNQFIAPGFTNRAWGLPLYYSAQIIFAYTCVGGF